MINPKLLKETEYLFNRNYEDDLPVEEEDSLEEYAEKVISEYDWRDTFAAWTQYLKTHCATPESVINYANLF